MKRFYRKPAVLPAVLLMAALVSGCGMPFFSRGPLPERSPEMLLQEMNRNVSRLNTFTGRARLTVMTEEGPFAGSLQIAARMPDSLWVKVEGPLGVDMATGRFSGGKALFYSPWQNVAYRGDVEDMRNQGLLPWDAGSGDMVLSLLGLLSPGRTLTAFLDTVSIDGREYVVRLKTGEEIRIDPRGPLVTRWEKRGWEGDVQWIWEAADIRKVDGMYMPRQIRILNMQPRQRLTLVYETVKMNKPMKSEWSRVPIPEGVETIEL